ncbi:MAG TPA: GlsB/YeaQ/YmgE family stress response membrane protein [Acidimicrobiales bacterium]|nr:GlsB/YeaQ/YmgE family stress response membrane protein [Acidimicrobiales bacterium]
MSILGWIVVGFIAGILARWVTGARSLGCLVTTVVGILGGVIGGALFRLATDNDTDVVDDFDIGSIYEAFLGAVLLLLLLEALSRDRRW